MEPDFQSVAGVDADLIVVDADATQADGMRAIPRPNGNGARVKILVAGSASVGALDAGVSGYIPKNSSRDRIISEIRAAFRGGHYLSPRISRHVIAAADSDTLQSRTPTT